MSLTEALVEAVQSLPSDKQQEVLDFAEFLRDRGGKNAPPPQPKIPLPTQSGLSALVEQWRQEDETTDEAELQAAQAELDEFKRNLNANRAATGERLLFP